MKTIYLYIFILLVSCFCSCNGYLDVKPKGEVLPKTAEEFSALLNSHLNDLDYGSETVILGDASTVLNYECYTDNLDMSLIPDNFKTLPVYVGKKINSWRETYASLYAVIRDCNLVIDNLKERDSEMGKKVLATAYALRGVCYFNLLRNFCLPYDPARADEQLGLSIVERFDMEGQPLRSDLKTTVEFIEESLKTAIDFHSDDKTYRFTEDVTKAYLARLYLWSQNWSAAIPLAEEILKKYPLVEGEVYKKMIQDRFGQLNNVLIRSYIFSGVMDWYYGVTRTDASKCPVSKEFVSLFTEQDRDIRYAISFNGKREPSKHICGRVRSAEMCLILAECHAHLEKPELALKYLNDLRSKRITGNVDYTEATLPVVDLTALVKVDATGKALSRLMAAILNERRKELFMESDRWYELKRNGSPEFWVTNEGFKYEMKKYLYTTPIPKFDVELVDGLIQNEGYEY